MWLGTDMHSRRAQTDADDKLRKELGWKAAQENRLAWQEKLSNQQHERNRAVETKLVEQMRKNNSDVATNTLLEARMRAPCACKTVDSQENWTKKA